MLLNNGATPSAKLINSFLSDKIFPCHFRLLINFLNFPDSCQIPKYIHVFQTVVILLTTVYLPSCVDVRPTLSAH